jgi:hypothetical protein
MSTYGLVDGHPTMTDSIVLFLDVLGSKDWATGTGAQDYLNLLYDVLSKNLEKYLESNAEGQFSVLTFTDNIVLGWPTDGSDFDVRACLRSVSMLASLYQSELAMHGVFVRGGVSRGLMYMDDKIAFGPALVDAYNLEQSAIYPRIVVSKSLAAESIQNGVFSLYQGTGPDKDYLISQDDQIFLNYLEWLPYTGDEKKGLLQAHKVTLEKAIAEFAYKPKVWAKYCWLADYHDFVIRMNHKEWADLLINANLRTTQFHHVSPT